MTTLIKIARAVGVFFALTTAAAADEPLKIATSAEPVGQLVSFAANLAKAEGDRRQGRRVHRLGGDQRGGVQPGCRC